MFESPAILAALFGVGDAASLEETFDMLADAVDAALDIEAVERALRETVPAEARAGR
jgi:hypothetical protein